MKIVRWTLLCGLIFLAGVTAGVFFDRNVRIRPYESDAVRRMHQLMKNEEELRVIGDEWEREWFKDAPAEADHVHGGITPGITNDRPR